MRTMSRGWSRTEFYRNYYMENLKNGESIEEEHETREENF